MISHRETRIVPYPAELMYAVVSDVEKYPEFLPWVVALRVLARDENRLTAEMAVGYGALREPAATEDYGDRLTAKDVMVYARKLGEVSARVEGRIILR